MTAHRFHNQKRVGFSATSPVIKSWLRFTLIGLLLLCALTISIQERASAGFAKRVPQAPLVLLESSEGPINQGSSARAIALSNTDGQVLYAVDRSSEAVVAQETLGKATGKIRSFAHPQNVESIVVGQEGNIYLADSVSGQVRVVSPTGESLRTVPVAKPYALGVLGNGNLVVASTAGADLLHLYDPTGSRLFTFGEMRLLDNRSHKQNRYLNRGKIAVGPSDTIYYVSRFAPTPIVRKYSSDGELVSEFAISGDAVDFQVNIANDFLREKEPGRVGGFDVITCATVDASTGHLWIGMNGTSKTGVVYEYDASGVKLREYAFVLKGSARYTDVITGVKDLVVRNNSIYLLTWEGIVYRFSGSNSVSLLPQRDKNQTLARWLDSRFSSFFAAPSVSASATSPLAGLQAPSCPTAQPLTCVANCRSGANPTTENCGSEVTSRLGQGDILIGGSCSNSAGPEPSCNASGNFCNTTTGTRGTISLSRTCNAPPPPPPPPGGGEGGEECPQGCPPDTVCYDGLCSYASPILVDVSGSGFRLTDLAGGVDFDFNRDRRTERISWTAVGSDNAWLVLDRNGNGTIDDATELFGNLTPQPMSADPNGFIALAEFDKRENGGNGDGRIDRRDSIFSSLRLWQDENHNAISEPTEMQPPQALGVKAFGLVYQRSRRVDQFGNQFKYRAKVYDKSGGSAGKWAWDVYLRKGS